MPKTHSTSTNNRPLVFVTLGPAGTNHQRITDNYIKFRGLSNAEIILVDDFEDALEKVASGHADFILICGVHPQCADIVGKGSFSKNVHVMDVFISSSQELAILTRTEVDKPQTIALQPATQTYTDISSWPEKIYMSSIMRIAEGLLQGKFDSGLTTLQVAKNHPKQLRVDTIIGSPDDPWVVLGRKRLSNGELMACKESPITKVLLNPP